MIWAPCFGWLVITVIGAWMYDGESSNEKCCRIMATAILASINAKLWPIQILARTPLQKGKMLFDALMHLKAPAKIFLAWIRPHHHPIILDHGEWEAQEEQVGLQVGVRISQGFVLLFVCRTITPPKYNLKASYRTIDTCSTRNIWTLFEVIKERRFLL